MGEMADLFDLYWGEEYERERDTERDPVELGFMPVENTVFSCEKMAELQQHNALLVVQNKELLARCDLLEAELCRFNCEIETIVMTLEE